MSDSNDTDALYPPLPPDTAAEVSRALREHGEYSHEYRAAVQAHWRREAYKVDALTQFRASQEVAR